ERVQDRRVRLEDFVEEDDLRVGEHPFGASLVTTLAKGGDIDGAEDLVRLGEARQQVLEVASLHEAGERADESALRRSRRPNEDGVLARDRRHEEQADDLR